MKNIQVICLVLGLWISPDFLNAQSFTMGFELEGGPCSNEFEALADTVLSIKGWTTLASTADVSALSQSIEVRSPDGAQFCIGSPMTVGDETRLAPTETCDLDCKNSLLPTPLLPQVTEPLSFVIQADDGNCPTGVGNPSTSANMDRRGLVDTSIFEIGMDMTPVNNQRTLPFEIFITVPPKDQPPVTIELIYVDGLQGPGGVPNKNALTVNFKTVSQDTASDLDVDLTLESCTFTVKPRPGGFQRPGDFDQSGVLDISDAIELLKHLFLGNPAMAPCADGSIENPANLALLDTNGDGRVDLSDVVDELLYILLGGAPPVQGVDCLPIPDCPDEICLE